MGGEWRLVLGKPPKFLYFGERRKGFGVETLKTAITNNKRFEPPELSLFYGLMAEMEQWTPTEILLPRKWSKIRRAARLEFVSQICGRQIDSFGDCWGQELYLLSVWFSDHQPQYTVWCLENVVKIHERAGVGQKPPEA